MATAHAEYLGWLERLHAERQDRAVWTNILERNTVQYEPPRISSAEAVEEAAAMAERFHRLFVRAVRTLRELRRFTPSVVVQNAGQVNVGAQQVNSTVALDEVQHKDGLGTARKPLILLPLGAICHAGNQGERPRRTYGDAQGRI
jgi:hypothetical protein